ncbi:trafficking regulator of GLUT4 (SLC2A4) 1b [Xyrauchen texanus]|uniref:trafficking regulator of GLUT4 (SLC2A4) 1b n=1 Tax=Xyrauchen texanus TaxID=154827 RepID=UPI0022426050|nr:trafficking regulator of GLUT4 (SLC2A4) 1b [Xyrauchen texanus]
MAINTDAPHSTGSLGVAVQSTDFGDTDKLLDISTKELERELNKQASDTSVSTVGTEQNEPNSDSTIPVHRSPSRISFSRSSSPTTEERKARSFMWLAVFSCFFPAIPINLFAIYFAHLSLSLKQERNYVGARKLGHLALLLAVVSIVVGLAIILYVVMTETQLFK